MSEQEEKLPVNEYVKVLKHVTLGKSKRFWSAIVYYENSRGRKMIAYYLWVKVRDKWKRKDKAIFRSRHSWEETKQVVDAFFDYLDGKFEEVKIDGKM